MSITAEKLKNEITKKAKEKNFNPFSQSFKPSDLGINSDKYGSFSDFCSPKDTISGKWNKDVILKAVEWKKK